MPALQEQLTDVWNPANFPSPLILIITIIIIIVILIIIMNTADRLDDIKSFYHLTTKGL